MKCTECNNHIRPVVAHDIDGSLGMYHDQLQWHMENYVGRALPRDWDGSGNWEDYLGIPRELYQEMKLSFRQGGYKRFMPAYPGAKDACRKIMKAGAELWITTTRPYMRLDSVDPDTREWLRRCEVEYDHLLYDEDKYAKLADLVGAGRVVAVVEDLPEQYERAIELFGSHTAILLERPHNQAYRDALRLTDGHVAPTVYHAAEIAQRNIVEWHRINA